MGGTYLPVTGSTSSELQVMASRGRPVAVAMRLGHHETESTWKEAPESSPAAASPPALWLNIEGVHGWLIDLIGRRTDGPMEGGTHRPWA